MSKKAPEPLQEWALVQKRTFTRWVNVHLADRGLKVEDLIFDLSDGILLDNLLEIISNKKLPKWNKVVKFPTHKLENNSAALTFLKTEGIKLVAIGPEDIVNRHPTLILGLIWTIILRYQIQKGQQKAAGARSSPKEELLQWLALVMPQRKIRNFNVNWQDGSALHDLVNAVGPGTLPSSYLESPLQTATRASEAAEEAFHIPPILAPSDMVSPYVDELSVITYVSYFRDYAAAHPVQEGDAAPAPVPAPTPAPSTAVPEEPAVDLNNFSVDLTGLNSPSKDGSVTFVIVGKTKLDEPIIGAQFHAPIAVNGNTVPATIVDNKNGTYGVAFTPNEEGDYIIQVNHVTTTTGTTPQAADAPLPGSPFTFHITKKPQREEVDVNFDGIGEDPNEDGEVYFVITPKDPATPGELVTEISFGQQGASLPSRLVPEDQAYKAFFAPESTGEYKVVIGRRGGDVSASEEADDQTGLRQVQGSPYFVDIDIPEDEIVRRRTLRLKKQLQADINALDFSLIGKDAESVPHGGVAFHAEVDPAVWARVADKAHPLPEGVKVEQQVVFASSSKIIPSVLSSTPSGQYQVLFYPPKAGEYQVALELVDLYARRFPIKNSPFKVDVAVSTLRHRELDPTVSEAVMNEEGEAEITLNLAPKDSAHPHPEGVEKHTPVYKPKILLDGEEVDAKIRVNEDDTYTITFKPTTTGHYKLTVDLVEDDAHHPLKGSPFPRSVTVPERIDPSTIVDPAKTLVEGEGIHKAAVGVPATFIVRPCNAEGNPISPFEGKVAVSVTDEDGDVEVEITPSPDGVTVSYTPTSDTDHVIKVQMESQDVASSPYRPSVHAPLSPGKCFADGPGLEEAEVGEKAVFSVFGRNALNKLHPLPDEASVTVEIQPEVSASKSLQEDGSVSVQYSPKTRGDHQVSVEVNGTPVRGSPFTVVVSANKLDASRSTLEGGIIDAENVAEGEPVEAEAGKDAWFGIVARNALGEPLPHRKLPKDLPVHVAILPAGGDDNGGEVKASVEQQDDDADVSFKVSFTTPSPGAYTIQGRIGETPLRNSPVKLNVISTGSDPNNTIAHGPGLDHAERHYGAHFTVEPKDARGKNVPKELSGTLEVHVRALSRGNDDELDPVHAHVHHNEDGSFKVEYTPKHAGPHEIEVAISGHKIAKSPFRVEVASLLAVAEHSEVKHDPETSSQAEVDTPLSYTILARNVHNDALKEGGEGENFTVTVEPENAATHAQIKDNGDGTYAAIVTPRVSGSFHVAVRLKGEHIRGSPVESVAQHAPLDPHATIVGWDVLDSVKVDAGEVSVHVQVVNVHGKLVPSGGAHIDATLTDASGTAIDTKVHDGGDGKYAVTFTPKEDGQHALALRLHPSLRAEEAREHTPEHHVKGSPYKFTVSPSESKIALDKVEIVDVPTSGEVDVPVTFAIHAKNAYGNPVANAGAVFKAKIVASSDKNEEEEEEIKIEDQGQGSYKGTIVPHQAGPHTLTVLYEGRPVSPTPASFDVHSLGADGAHCVATWEVLDGLKAKRDKVKIGIQARNKKGENLTTGGAIVVAKITHGEGEDDVEADVEDRNDGTYRVLFTPSVPGPYVANIGVVKPGTDEGGDDDDVTPIIGSPHSFTVDPSEREPVAEHSEIHGLADKGDVDQEVSFNVISRNAYKYDIEKGGDAFTLEVLDSDGEHVPSTLQDLGTGVYAGKFTPKKPGNHTVKVQLNDTHLPSSPKTFLAECLAIVPSKTHAFGRGLQNAEATVPSSFTVALRDKNDDPVPNNGAEVHVDIKHAATGKEVPAKVVQEEDSGDFKIEYVPVKAGPHVIEVKVQPKHPAEEHTLGPYHPEVTPSSAVPHAPVTTLSVHGDMTMKDSQVGRAARFQVRPLNYAKEPVKDAADFFEGNVKGPDGSSVPIIFSNGDDKDTVEGSFVPKSKGAHQVCVCLKPEFRDHDDEEGRVQGSPAQVVVLPTADPTKTVVRGLDAIVTDTVPALITLETRDEDGHPLGRGGDKVEATVDGPSGHVPADVTDNGDGTYDIKYAPSEHGKHVINATVNEGRVPGLPHAVTVEEGTDEEGSTAVDYTFTVRAKTKSGQNRPRGGDVLEVTITHVNGNAVEGIEVTDKGDGSYLVAYSLPEPGKYQVKVTLNGKNIAGSPWKQVC